MRKGRKIVFVLGLVGRVSVSIIVAKYNIFPRADNGRSREKKFQAKRFAHAISVHCRDLKHAYVYWIWLRGSASYVIKKVESWLPNGKTEKITVYLLFSLSDR